MKHSQEVHTIEVKYEMPVGVDRNITVELIFELMETDSELTR